MWTCRGNEKNKLQRVWSDWCLFPHPLVLPIIPPTSDLWSFFASVLPYETYNSKDIHFPVLKLFTNHICVHNLLCFSMFWFLFLSLHAIWEVWITKVPEQIACILACIAVCYLHPIYRLELRRGGIYNTFSFKCFIYISWMENKNSPITICRVHRTCTWNRMFAWLNKGCCLFAIAEKGIAQFCNRLRLWPVLLHCVTKIYPPPPSVLRTSVWAQGAWKG